MSNNLLINTHDTQMPHNNDGKGDWYDLYCCEDVTMKQGEYKEISLGISIQIPKGYTAYILPRSSTFRKYGILMVNSMGVIDSSYCGDDDIISFPSLAMRDTVISKGARIAQMTIMPNTDIKFEQVDKLFNPNRNGLGSTGV